MNKWMTEDCRLGIEKGDKVVFSYECPAGICHALVEASGFILKQFP